MHDIVQIGSSTTIVYLDLQADSSQNSQKIFQKLSRMKTSLFEIDWSNFIVRKGSLIKHGKFSARDCFPKSRPSYFRFARFVTSALYYLRAWHRLVGRLLRNSSGFL